MILSATWVALNMCSSSFTKFMLKCSMMYIASFTSLFLMMFFNIFIVCLFLSSAHFHSMWPSWNWLSNFDSHTPNSYCCIWQVCQLNMGNSPSESLLLYYSVGLHKIHIVGLIFKPCMSWAPWVLATSLTLGCMRDNLSFLKKNCSSNMIPTQIM